MEYRLHTSVCAIKDLQLTDIKRTKIVSNFKTVIKKKNLS
jgi:hypothetical protein